MGDVTTILLHACSSNPSLRVPAERQLEEAKNSGFGEFLAALVQEFRDESKPSESRQMAMIVLKNSVAFDAKDLDAKALLDRRWRDLDASVRNYVKSEVLLTLASPTPQVRYIAALMIANLARIEVPCGEWPALIGTLTAAAHSDQVQHVEAALTTLGYICEESDRCEDLEKALQSGSRAILEAVFAGLGAASADVKYFATNALCNAIAFIKVHMDDHDERKYIVDAICSMAKSDEPRTREKAMEALIRVASLYYEKLPHHIDQLYDCTMTAITQDCGSVGLQALEFWITVCAVEKELLSEDKETLGYAQAIMIPLFDVLAQCLTKQEEGQCDDDWNMALAASKVLQDMSEVVGDPIVDIVMPFVSEHIENPHWRQRDAALVAFGSMLIGPSFDRIKDIVMSSGPSLVNYAMNDANEMVRDSALWVLCVVANEFPLVLLNDSLLKPTLDVAIHAMHQSYMMAERGCAIIHNLSNFFDDDDDDEETPSTALSPYYKDLVGELLAVIDQANIPDNLRNVAIESLNALIGACAPDTIGVLEMLVPEVLNRLSGLIEQRQRSPDSQIVVVEIYVALWCGALNHLAKKMSHRIAPFAELVMRAIAAVCSTTGRGSVQDEALLCIGSVALALRDHFVQYMPIVGGPLLQGLRTTDEYDLCICAIGTVGDICSALGRGAADAMADVMSIFSDNLGNPEVDRDLKANIISCIGDIALRIGPLFEPYLDGVFGVLVDFLARSETLNMQDDEDNDYAMSLWDAVAHCMTGMVQGFKSGLRPMLPHMQTIMVFVNTVGSIAKDDDDTFKSVVSLVGDVANVVAVAGREVVLAAKQELLARSITDMIDFACNAPNEDVREAAEWSREQLQALSRIR